MEDPQTLPLWFVPLIPVMLVAFWVLVIGVVAELGGWGELGRLYPEPRGLVRAPVRSFRTASLDLRRGWFPLPTNYGSCIVMELSQAGLHLRTWLPFRFRHPPLLIPWGQIERAEPGTLFFFRTLTLHPRGTTTRIRTLGAPARAIEEVLRQGAIARPEPARV
jgi:hypothetical protein